MIGVASSNQPIPIALRGYHWTQGELESTPLGGIFYLALNMTSACNYRCPYCFVGLKYLRTGRDELTLREKISVVRQAAENGARVLTVPGRGEPLGDPDFWEILSEANRSGLYVVVYTNAYFLDEEKIKKLQSADISLYVKVDSFKPEVYEALVGKTGVYLQVRKNLDLILEYFHRPIAYGSSLLSRFGINSVVTTQSVDSIAEIGDWCRANHVFYTCRSPVNVGEASLNWPELVGDQVEALRTIGQRFSERNYTSATPKGQCGIYRFGITIENNGEVYVCPDARIDAGFGAIGNVRTSSLQQLIVRRAELYPIDSRSGFCFVKSALNPEEQPLVNLGVRDLAGMKVGS